MSQDTRSIDGADVTGEALCAFAMQPPCECSTCRNYSRSYLHALLRDEASEALAAQLITAHNVAYMMALMRSMREARIA
jgi:queuine tRNA-ribosyltransferase